MVTGSLACARAIDEPTDEMSAGGISFQLPPVRLRPFSRPDSFFTMASYYPSSMARLW